MKLVADTLGVARSNLVDHLKSKSKPRGRYRRDGDDELIAAIRQLTDARPTYGYRRITALLNRSRRAAGAALVNHKRVFRLMGQANLLLAPHVGHRPVRAHEGRVIAPASNLRWSSDGLEISCWNGEVVRVIFAIDTHDREIIAWQASTGGISGEMVRDLMLACVERRFSALRAPHPVQWLADNGSAYIPPGRRWTSPQPSRSCPASHRSEAPRAMASARRSSKPSNAIMRASSPGRMRSPSSSNCLAGSTTTTRTTHIAA